MQRVIVFDTETTGLQSHEGHRMASFAAVEMVWDDKKDALVPTGRKLDLLFDPERDFDSGASATNGFTREMLRDKPKFAEKAKEIIEFFRGEPGTPPAALIAHNAPFDVGMLNMEMERAGHRHWQGEAGIAGIGDTRPASATLWPGKEDENGNKISHTLDAVCERLGIDLSSRADHHGALIDTLLLAEAIQGMMKMEGGHRAIAATQMYDKALRSTSSTLSYSKEWVAAAALVAPLLAQDHAFCSSVATHKRNFIKKPQALLPKAAPAVDAAIDVALSKTVPDEVRGVLQAVKENASETYDKQQLRRNFTSLCQETLVKAQAAAHKGIGSRLCWTRCADGDVYGRGDVVMCATGLADLATGGATVPGTIEHQAVAKRFLEGLGENSSYCWKTGSFRALGRFAAQTTEVVEELIREETNGACEIKYLGKQFTTKFTNAVKKCLINELEQRGIEKDALQTASIDYQSEIKAVFSARLGERFFDSREAPHEVRPQDLSPVVWVQTLITATRYLVNQSKVLRGEPMHRAALELDKALCDMEKELHTFVEKQVTSHIHPQQELDEIGVAGLIHVVYPDASPAEISEAQEVITDGVPVMLAAACKRCPEGSAADRVFEQLVTANINTFLSKKHAINDDACMLNNMEWARSKVLDAIQESSYDVETCERLSSAVASLEFAVHGSDAVTEELVQDDLKTFFTEGSPEEFINYVGSAAASSQLFVPGEVGDDIIKLNACTESAMSSLTRDRENDKSLDDCGMAA